MPLITDSESRPVGSYPDSGIEVLIVGTGLAGLTASIECIRKGHSITVLERYDDINTAGMTLSVETLPTVVGGSDSGA